MASLESIYGEDPSVISLIRDTLQVKDATTKDVIYDLSSDYPLDSYLRESLQYIALMPHLQQDGPLNYIR